jgi:Fe-S oxidoreductase
MLDEKLISDIRESGTAEGAAGVAPRDRLLREMGFRTADRAEYALLASCFLPSLVPAGMRAFRLLLEHLKVDYTLLRKEYCCGDILLRQAARDKTGAEMERADALAREFLEKNLAQARQAGAKKVIAFCVGCDLVHTRFRDSVPEEILWYPTLLARLFQGGRLDLEADYYPGCHYHYRRLNKSLPDLDSARELLNRIEGLRIHHLDGRLCCTRPEQVGTLLSDVKSGIVITPCGGCASGLQPALTARGSGRAVMLPEVLWAAVSGQRL